MNMGLPLYCVSQCPVVPVLNSRIHELSLSLPAIVPPFVSRPMPRLPTPNRPWHATGHFPSDEQQQMLVVFAHPADLLPSSLEPDRIFSTPSSFPFVAILLDALSASAGSSPS